MNNIDAVCVLLHDTYIDLFKDRFHVNANTKLRDLQQASS